MNPKFKKFKLNGINALTIYEYDDKLKDLIYQLKGCKDIELSSIFLSPFLIELKIQFFNYVIVLAPSFFKDNEERGFNHVNEIFKYLNLKIYDCLIKTEKHKQAEQNFIDRHKIKEFIKFSSRFNLEGKKILLVDDVCTTGSTLVACSEILKKQKIRSIKILVISKRELSKEEKAEIKDPNLII